MGHAFVAMFNNGASQSQRKLADLERFSDPEEKQRAAGEGSWILQKTLPNPRECSRETWGRENAYVCLLFCLDLCISWATKYRVKVF